MTTYYLKYGILVRWQGSMMRLSKGLSWTVEVRGGDQAVVKENDELEKPIFFGGVASAVKRFRTRTRASGNYFRMN